MGNSQTEWDFSSLKRGTAEAKRKMREAVTKGLWEGMQILGNESYRQCPFDEGDLSGTQEIKKTDKDGLEYEIAYRKPYAARMHEHPEYKFKNGRKAKYLEDPIKQNSGKWQDRIGDNIKVTFSI